MYVCVYIYICMCVYIPGHDGGNFCARRERCSPGQGVCHVYIYKCIYIHIFICIYVYIYMYICVCMTRHDRGKACAHCARQQSKAWGLSCMYTYNMYEYICI